MTWYARVAGDRGSALMAVDRRAGFGCFHEIGASHWRPVRHANCKPDGDTWCCRCLAQERKASLSEAVASFREKRWRVVDPQRHDHPTPRPVGEQCQDTRTVRSPQTSSGSAANFIRVSPLPARYPEAWRAIRSALGQREAHQLAQLKRNEAMVRLRVKHRWSLQAIADLFGLSRERVRQLTPTIEGNGRTPVLSGSGKPFDLKAMREELENVFRQATRDPDAWDGRGQISKPWVVEKLGYEPDLPGFDFRSPADSKAGFILRYGLGLETKADMRSWVKEMYFGQRMTYGEIAARLSEAFVPVAAMTVHRFVTDVLDMEGYGRGTRNDREAPSGALAEEPL